jgi:hypothetical protein
VEAIAKGTKGFAEVCTYAMETYKQKFLLVRQHYDKMLKSFRKHFTVDVSKINNLYKQINEKNLAIRIKNQVKKE